MKRSIAFILVLGSLLLGVSGSASATSDVLGCVTSRGKLRLVPSLTQCRPREAPIQWNAVGPAGTPGGPALARAFSDAGPVTLLGSFPIQFPFPTPCFAAPDPDTCGYVPLGTVRLGPGEWAVSAKVWLSGTRCGEYTANAECRLVASATGDSTTAGASVDHSLGQMVSLFACGLETRIPYSSTQKQAMSLQLTHASETSSDLAVLYCRNNDYPGNSIAAHDVAITAIQITTTPPPDPAPMPCGLSVPACDGECPPGGTCILSVDRQCECIFPPN